MSVTQTGHDTLLSGWRSELEAVSEQARRLTEGLTEEQLRWRPTEGSWSIGQVFEHLVTSNGSYLPQLREVIRGAARGDGRERPWKPSLVGGFMIRSLDPSSTRRLPAPRIWRPGPEPRPGVVEAFLQLQEELARLMHEAEGVDLARTRTRSPVSSLIRMNLGDAFRILLVHAQRHLGQVRRIRDSPGFPLA